MGMSMEDNEMVVAKTIEHESKEVFPLAIRVKEFNVRSLTKLEVEVSLERLKRKGVITNYRHGWGLIAKHNGQSCLTYERTGDEPIYDGGEGLQDDEVFEIEFDSRRLKTYLNAVKRGDTSKPRVVERRGDDFYLNDRRIPFDTYNSIHYCILNILYGDDGSSKRMSYEDIADELKNAPCKLNDADNLKIRNAINNGLYRQAGKDIEKHVKIEPREGLVFDNPQKT